MKKILLCLFAATLLVALAGCPQGNAGETGAEASVQPAEETASAAPEELSPDTSEEPSVGEGEQPSPSASEPQGDAPFDAMEIDVEQGTMYIRTGASFSYTKEDGGQAEYDISDGVLRISQQKDHKTVLTVPEGTVYTSLALAVGEGHVYAESGLSIRSLELNVTHGEAALSALSVSDNSTVEVDQGSVSLSGDPGASVTASSKEGHINLEVWTAQSDYNFEIDVSTGNLRLGTESYHGRSYSKSIDNGANRSMALHCSRGDLSVEFNGR